MAAAEAVIDADFEDGPAEVSEKPRRRERVRSGGGGGGGGFGDGGGGGGFRTPTPKIDRAFNQDDLVSVLIVLALLLLFGLFLIRGNGAPSSRSSSPACRVLQPSQRPRQVRRRIRMATNRSGSCRRRLLRPRRPRRFLRARRGIRCGPGSAPTRRS